MYFTTWGCTMTKIGYIFAAILLTEACTTLAVAGASSAGAYHLSSSYYISVATPPEIFSFNPTVGQTGSSVTINGQFFTGATEVTFNNIPTGYVVNNDS